MLVSLLRLFVIVSFFGFSSCSQSVSNQDVESSTSGKFLAKPDSVIEQTPYGVIYLSGDTSSRVYDWLIPSDDNIRQPYFDEYVSHITKTNNISLNHFPIRSLEAKWTTLYWFDGHYCLYGPSDWMASTGYVVSDSICYIAKPDGDLRLILDYQEITSRNHKLKLIDYNGLISFISIELIDRVRGVSIWSAHDSTGTLIYEQLMVESNRVKDFPILVFDCGDAKCAFEREIEYFGRADFDSLRTNTR